MTLKIIKKHLPYLIFAIIIYAILSVGVAGMHNWYNPPFLEGSDLNVHIPRAFKLDDPRLFSRDPSFKSFSRTSFCRLDCLLYPLLLSKLFPLLGGIKSTVLILSFILGLVFVIGIYGLTYYLSGDFLAAILTSFLASLDYRALGGVQLGFTPEYVLPRNFVVAISPVIIILFLYWRDKKSLWVLYAGLGLMANFHTLVTLHLVAILTLALLITSGLSWSTFKKVLVGGVVSLICASPSVMFFLPKLMSVLIVDAEEAAVIVAKYNFTLSPWQGRSLIFLLNFLPFALLGSLGFYQTLKRSDIRSDFRVYVTLYLIVLILPWVGVLINLFTLSFRQLELLRISRYYFLFNLVPVGMLLSGWLQERKRSLSILMPVVLIIITVLSRYEVGGAIVVKAIEWVRPKQVVVIETENDVEQLKMVWDWERFSDLSRWVEANTPIDALFLTPTYWNQFPVYARRGAVVTWKLPGWPGWAEAYTTVQGLYGKPDAQKFVEVAQMYDADYVVVMPGFTLPGLKMVYQNDSYVIYKTR